MYCVQCGVRLQDGAGACPLCGTPVAAAIAAPATGGTPRTGYSDLYPGKSRSGRFLMIGLISTVMLAASLGCLIFCLRTEGAVNWSGYVMLSCATAWIWFIFPLCFRKWRPMVFLPIDFACAAGLLLYICEKNGGKWFLSFAFPVTGIAAAVTIGAVAMARSLKQGRLWILAGLLMAIGGSFMLIEFFQHITFGTPMFVWSLYCVIAFCGPGLFLLIAGCIPPLRSAIRRRFFF